MAFVGNKALDYLSYLLIFGENFVVFAKDIFSET